MPQSKVLRFTVFTTHETEKAEQKIAQFEARLDSATGTIKQFGYNLQQNVGLTSEKVTRQLGDLQQVANLAAKQLQETSATAVIGKTDDLKLVVSDLGKVDAQAVNLTKTLIQLQEHYSRAISSVVFKKEMSKVTDAFASNIKASREAKDMVAQYATQLAKTGNSMKAPLQMTKDFAERLSAEFPDKPITQVFEIEPKVVTSLKNLNEELVQGTDSALKASTAAQKFTDAQQTLQQASNNAQTNGLQPLNQEFQHLNTTVSQLSNFGNIGNNLNQIASVARQSATPFASLDSQLGQLANSSVMAQQHMQPLRNEITKLQNEVRKRQNIIAFANELEKVGQDTSIKNMKGLRSEISRLQQVARQSGLDELDKDLEQLGKTIDEGGGRVKNFKVRLQQAATTTRAKAGVEDITNAVDKLGDEFIDASKEIDPLMQKIRKFGISPSANKDLGQATNAIRGIAEEAGVKTANKIDNLANSFSKTANKAAEVTKKGGGLSTTLKQLAVAATGTGKLFGDLSVKASKVLIAFGIWGVIKNSLRDVTQLITGISKAVFNLAEESAKLRDSEIAFRRLVGAAGDADVILARTYAEVEGVIERVEAVGAATRAALTGLPMDRFAELARGARALAAATGRDASEAIDRLTNAIAKQERRLLDELGIVVRADDIYRQYARSHNLVASELTASQKKFSFFEAVLDKVNEKMMALGGAVDQAQLPFNQLRASVRGLRVAFGGWLDRTFGVSKIVSDIASSIGDLADSFNSMSETASESTASVLQTGDAIKMFSETVPAMVDEGRSLINVLKLSSEETDNTIAHNKRLEEITQSLVGLFPQYADILRNNLAEALQLVSSETKQAADLQSLLYDARLRKALLDNARAYDEATDSVEKYQDKVMALKVALDSAVVSGEETVDLSKLDADTRMKVLSTYNMTIALAQTQRVTVKSLTENLNENSKALGANNDALQMQRLHVAALVKSKREQGAITQKEIEMMTDLTKSEMEHTIALADIASKTGIHTKYLEDSINQIIAATQATDNLGEATRKTAEEIDKMLSELNKSWEFYGNTVLRASENLSDIKNAEVTLTNLQRQRTQIEDTLISNLNTTAERAPNVLNMLLDNYRKYFNEQNKMLDISNDEERRQQADIIKQYRAGLDEHLDIYGIQLSSLQNILELDKSISDQEAKINALRAKNIIDLAKLRITKNDDVAKNAVEAAKFEISTWKSTLSKLEALGLATFNLRKQMNDNIIKSEAELTKAIRNEQKRRNQLMLQSQTDAIETLTKITGGLVGVRGTQAADMMAELRTAFEDLPQYYQELAKEVQTSLSGVLETGEGIDRSIVVGIHQRLRNELKTLRDEYAKMMVDLPEYEPFVKKIEDAMTDMDVTVFKGTLLTALKVNDFLEDIAKARTQIVEAESVKRVNAIENEMQRRVAAAQDYLEGNKEIENALTAMVQDATVRRGNIRWDNEQVVLDKISDATTFKALRTAEKLIDIEEYTQQGIIGIRERANDRFNELLSGQMEDIKVALAAQAGMEEIARVNRIRKQEYTNNKVLQNLRTEAMARDDTVQELKQIDEMIAFNRLSANSKVEMEHRKIQLETRSAILQFESSVTDNQAEQSKLRLQLTKLEYETKLEMARAFYVNLMETTEDPEKWREARRELNTIEQARDRLQSIFEEAIAQIDDTKLSELMSKIVGALPASVLKFEYDTSQIRLNATEALSAAAEIFKDTSYMYDWIEKEIGSELASQLLDVWEQFSDEIAKAAVKFRVSNREAFLSAADAFDEFADSVGVNVKKIIGLFDKFENVILNIIKTIAVFRKGGNVEKYLSQTLTSLGEFALEIFNIVNDQQNKIADLLRESAEETKQMMIDAAAETGRAVGDALSRNMEVDFEKLLTTFVKSAIAERISQIFINEFAGLFNMLERATQREAPRPEDVQRIANQMQRQFAMQGIQGLTRMLEMAWEPEVHVPAIKVLNKMLEDGLLTNAEFEELAEFILSLRFGLIDVGTVVGDIFDKFKEQEPRLKAIVSQWERATGLDFGEEEKDKEKEKEDIEKAFEGMVTEAQANQMIVLMGRQTDYLNEIANNTYKMAGTMFIQPKPQPQEVLPPEQPVVQQLGMAPTLNAIDINERLVIEINGEGYNQFNSIDDVDTEYLANVLDRKKQEMINRRTQAIGRWDRRRRVNYAT